MGVGAVVFDLDDTLYPEREYVFSGFAAVAREYSGVLGSPERAAEDMRRLFEGPVRGKVFDALLAERGMDRDPSLVAGMVETYRLHSPTIKPYPDAAAALVRLRPRLKLGLISDGRSIAQRAKLEAIGLRSRFDGVIVTSELGADADSVTFAKPNPRAFELMAVRLGVDGRSCCYVADNAAKDFLAPDALGWLTIRVRRADGLYRDAAAPPGGAAQHDVESLDAIDALLS